PDDPIRRQQGVHVERVRLLCRPVCYGRTSDALQPPPHDEHVYCGAQLQNFNHVGYLQKGNAHLQLCTQNIYNGRDRKPDGSGCSTNSRLRTHRTYALDKSTHYSLYSVFSLEHSRSSYSSRSGCHVYCFASQYIYRKESENSTDDTNDI
ncbi:hypothetical protein J6590_107538, partial [Homalodisca vitripennis]